MARVAIVGGGPGGLFANYLLDTLCAGLSEVTIFEASSRLGGKIMTRSFDAAPDALYEAGVAELYDYSHIGPDPIRKIIEKLGLKTVPLKGETVVLGDAIMKNDRDIKKHLGADALAALDDFLEQCSELLTPTQYYEAYQDEDNGHPWASKTFQEVLDTIPNEAARLYVAAAARSDTATEPYLTNALNGLKNILMDDRDFLRLYSVEGGVERIVDGLKALVSGKIRLDSPVTKIAKVADGYEVSFRHKGKTHTDVFDYVVCALPNTWLGRITWGDRAMRQAMETHLAKYDRPAHYLRVNVLFKKPFWRDAIPGNYWVTDAFGGACVYDESSRHPTKKHAILSWLIAGGDALTLSNLDDKTLVDMALDSLPAELASGRKLAMESRVHRWVATVNAQPGGARVDSMQQKAQPDAENFPGLFVCGDYMQDSTVNGTFDSAAFVVDLLLTKLRAVKYAGKLTKVAEELRDGQEPANENQVTLSRDYHDEYANGQLYEDSFKEYFCEHYTCDLIEAIWGWKPPYRLLDCGSANGLTLECFKAKNVEAWGIENNEHVHARTAPEWKSRNLLGDIRHLPFEDGFFDFVYDTSLCYVPEEFVDKAIQELFRVCKVGVFFGGITSDMTKEVIEYHEIFDGVQTLGTQWEWAERFTRNGFRLAMLDQKVLKKAWKIECDANEDDYPWYPDMETMRYCFFSKPDAAKYTAEKRGEVSVLRRAPKAKTPKKVVAAE